MDTRHGSESDKLKHSSIQLEVGSESASNIPSTSQLEEAFNVSRNGVNLTTLPHEIINNQHSPLHQMPIDGNDSRKQVARNTEATIDEAHQIVPIIELGSCSSASSTFSDSSLDLFQIPSNTIPEPALRTDCPPKPNEAAKSLTEDCENDTNVEKLFCEIEKSDSGLIAPSDYNPKTVQQQVLPPTLFPPTQVMERHGEYDPYRIPSSVFARNTTPVEWSVASNESLFSIQVGNNSFRADRFFVLGELGKSEELPVVSPPPPVIMEENERMADDDMNFETDGMEDKPIESGRATTESDKSTDKIPPPFVTWNSSCKSHNSDGSVNSAQSFAFPVKKKYSWPFYYCSNCSWAFCYCKWPRCSWSVCHFTWTKCHCSNCNCKISHHKGPRCSSSSCPNCSWKFCCQFKWPICSCFSSSNCSRAFCYRWNCRQERLGGGRNPSAKVDPQPPLVVHVKQHQELPSKNTPNYTLCKWFSCFSCCPHHSCCHC